MNILILTDEYFPIPLSNTICAQNIADEFVKKDVRLVFLFMEIAVVEALASGLVCLISENIPEEADMGAELICKRHLEEGFEVWADTIIQLLLYERINTEKYIVNLGFDIIETERQIRRLYCDFISGKETPITCNDIRTGGKYGKSVNS